MYALESVEVDDQGSRKGKTLSFGCRHRSRLSFNVCGNLASNAALNRSITERVYSLVGDLLIGLIGNIHLNDEVEDGGCLEWKLFI